jgi:hypothetical protein
MSKAASQDEAAHFIEIMAGMAQSLQLIREGFNRWHEIVAESPDQRPYFRAALLGMEGRLVIKSQSPAVYLGSVILGDMLKEFLGEMAALR